MYYLTPCNLPLLHAPSSQLLQSPLCHGYGHTKIELYSFQRDSIQSIPLTSHHDFIHVLKPDNVSFASSSCSCFLSFSVAAVRPGFHQGKDDVYNMTSSPRGEALIINNKTFLNHSKDRQGSEHDVLEVHKLFQDLGFKVTTKENLTKNEFLGELDAMACEDHSRYDCFVLWLMSHGDEDFVYGTDDEKIYLDTVRELFSNSSCSSLDGKPKVFFTQACRGDGEEFVESDGPQSARAPQKTLPLSERAKPANQLSHSRAHFLEAYSTVDGFYSYRNEKRGSYFVQCVVEVFRERVAHDDIDTMLIEVNRRLSQMQGRVLRGEGVKQVKLTCEFINRLTKKLYF